MSAAKLARQLKAPTNRITHILNGQRAVSGDTALRRACTGICAIIPPHGECAAAARSTNSQSGSCTRRTLDESYP
jgi:hypothetical protein